jgi:murein L,D-transpeptidase YcbB/YkuD
LFLTACSLAILFLGCSSDTASRGSAEEMARQAAEADSLLRVVTGRIRIRVEAERSGLDGFATTSDASAEESESVHLPTSVAQWYEHRNFAPAWVDGTGPRRLADSLLAILDAAPREGLPDTYHREEIRSRVQALRANSETRPPVHELVDLEFLCADAVFLYGTHLLTGRVSPTSVTPTWNVPSRTADLIAHLEKATASGQLSEMIANLRPQTPEYAALSRALQRYRALETAGGWPTLPDGPTLEADMIDPRVPLLRKRLALTGDLPVSADSILTDSTHLDSTKLRFDADLKAAMIRFQQRHGLDADGRVGTATRAALNVSASQRVDQLIANLERWRWMPDSLGERYIVVNIAGFDLRVVENGAEVLSMRVVTGRPFRQTPVFSDQISYLVLNPYWHVPHKLAVEDKLPDIRRNPSYLSQQGIEVFRGWDNAQPVNPATIEWASLSKTRFPYRLRQKPGPMNALGRIKFMFPNPYSVYLHDTPTRGLFARAERSFSSGCIRVEKPVELAEYLLGGKKGWTREKIDEVIAGAAVERSIILPEKVPVHLQYWTAWASGETVFFRNDIYNRDAPLLAALRSETPVQPSDTS